MNRKINLQIFATPNTQTTLMNGQSPYSNNLSPEMKTFYDKVLLEEAGPKLVHEQFGQKKPIPKNGGKTIEFRKFDNLPKALTPLTEGVTPDGNSLNVTTVTATIEQYGDYIVQSDMLEMTSLDNTIVEATKLLGQQAGLTRDTIVRDVLAGGTNDYLAGGAASRSVLASGFSLDDLTNIVARLRAQNAPTFDDGYYVCIVHPYVEADILKLLNTASGGLGYRHFGDKEKIYKGEIGCYGDVRFVVSSEAKIIDENNDGDSTLACPSNKSVYFCPVFGKGAFGVTEVTGGGLETIVKQKGYGDDPLNQRSSVGWKTTLTAEILMQNYLIRYECLSNSFPHPAHN